MTLFAARVFPACLYLGFRVYTYTLYPIFEALLLEFEERYICINLHKQVCLSHCLLQVMASWTDGVLLRKIAASFHLPQQMGGWSMAVLKASQAKLNKPQSPLFCHQHQ